MLLRQALRLGTLPRLALVGSGGKTTALFHLGRELLETQEGQGASTPTVFLAATTHMAVDQLNWADKPTCLKEVDDIVRLRADLPSGLILLTGPRIRRERISGVEIRLMEALLPLLDQRRIPLLIEADGSRQRPLKAPARHEPVIPGWVDMVVVVCGLSGLGKPLSSECVHRPGLFARLASLSANESITSDALVRVLTNSSGGLKNIPPGAKRVVLLNQADTPELRAAAYEMSGHLLSFYNAVVVAALSLSRLTDSRDRNIVEKSIDGYQPFYYPARGEAKIFTVYEQTAGIILAAGGSSRMGQVKQVLLWRGEPLVRHVTRTALAAGLSPVVVVTGSSAEQIESAVQDLPVSIVHNGNWQAGQSASVITGLNSLPPDTGSAVFLLADQPQLPVELVKELLKMHAIELPPIVAPRVMGQRANPVLFDRTVFPDLQSLTGDMGGRSLFSQYPVAWLDWGDDSITLDVDTLDDYHKLMER